ncbi:hypothetical protein [Actinomadura sp. SCN-SB]|uniref:hypothetical protein n=1 Tax=Actinomadura sp. SCN-SB TaxID=3373092 RepID=UPI003753D1F0
MSDRTPIEELRAAAQRLRDTAADATRGPWVSHPTITREDGNDSAWTICRPYCEGTPDGCEDDCGDDFLGEADADWIALMSPVLAESLAAWLDGVAKDVATHDPDDGCECTVSDSLHKALIVARSINGSES